MSHSNKKIKKSLIKVILLNNLINIIRKIIFYKNYFLDFYNQQAEDVQEKIDYVLDLISNVERVPTKFLAYLEDTDGLYEVRVKVGSNIYRIFCFFDEGKLVVLINSFQKKAEKTPKNELKKASKIKRKFLIGMK